MYERARKWMFMRDSWDQKPVYESLKPANIYIVSAFMGILLTFIDCIWLKKLHCNVKQVWQTSL